MDKKAYFTEALNGLETELTHQKQFLATLKRWAKQCQTEGWNPSPYQNLLDTWETNKSNVEEAIEEIKKQMK